MTTTLHQFSSKSDEKQISFINSLFFCSEFQSVSRIVIVHSSVGMKPNCYPKCLNQRCPKLHFFEIFREH